jgi:hypothetical protein
MHTLTCRAGFVRTTLRLKMIPPIIHYCKDAIAVDNPMSVELLASQVRETAVSEAEHCHATKKPCKEVDRRVFCSSSANATAVAALA